ncbi:2Fe-2S iron-sulfur cluster-binding protein [Paenibacillus sp. MBLB4367]|uniref:2Fe-2S iron-sulfur cluster-binding protein n=1 Tax=Paenibacillus sp. MBLB4367 TaxID=3384767 RepID=UPI0039082826
MIELKGKRVHKTVPAEPGMTILKLALKHDVEWGHLCTRGTCCRCRCLVTTGMNHLAAPTNAELDALEPEEIEEGYRLGCQAVLTGEGPVSVANKTYF